MTEASKKEFREELSENWRLRGISLVKNQSIFDKARIKRAQISSKLRKPRKLINILIAKKKSPILQPSY